MPDARTERDKALSQVEQAANERWKKAAAWSLYRVAQRMPEFTSEDVREYLEVHYPEVSTHEERAWGPIFMRAAKAEIIKKGGFTHYRRASRHATYAQVWISQIYKGRRQ